MKLSRGTWFPATACLISHQIPSTLFNTFGHVSTVLRKEFLLTPFFLFTQKSIFRWRASNAATDTPGFTGWFVSSFGVYSSYLGAITENERGTLENKKVPFPICPREGRCLVPVVARFASDYNAPHVARFVCGFVARKYTYATCPRSHDADSHIRYSSFFRRLSAIERDNIP